MDYKRVILGLLFVTGISCSTEDITPARLFIKELEDPSCYKDQFDYKDGHLVEFRRLFGQQVETITKFYYQADQLMKVHIKREQGIEHVIELNYGANGLRSEEKVTSINLGDTTNIKTGIFNYEDGLLISINYSADDPAYVPTETVFHWRDENIIQTDFYIYFEHGKHYGGNRKFTYDHGLNYSNQEIAFIYTVGPGEETKVSKNNIVTQQTKFGEEIFQGGVYTFTYNKSGYPIGYVHKTGEVKFTPIQISYW